MNVKDGQLIINLEMQGAEDETKSERDRPLLKVQEMLPTEATNDYEESVSL